MNKLSLALVTALAACESQPTPEQRLAEQDATAACILSGFQGALATILKEEISSQEIGWPGSGLGRHWILDGEGAFLQAYRGENMKDDTFIILDGPNPTIGRDECWIHSSEVECRGAYTKNPSIVVGFQIFSQALPKE